MERQQKSKQKSSKHCNWSTVSSTRLRSISYNWRKSKAFMILWQMILNGIRRERERERERKGTQNDTLWMKRESETVAREEGAVFGWPRASRSIRRLVSSKRMHVRRPTSDVYNLWSICIPDNDKSSRHPAGTASIWGAPTRRETVPRANTPRLLLSKSFAPSSISAPVWSKQGGCTGESLKMNGRFSHLSWF